MGMRIPYKWAASRELVTRNCGIQGSRTDWPKLSTAGRAEVCDAVSETSERRGQQEMSLPLLMLVSGVAKGWTEPTLEVERIGRNETSRIAEFDGCDGSLDRHRRSKRVCCSRPPVVGC